MECIMDMVKSIATHEGSRPDKFYKTTLFQSEALLLGLNCQEPGQQQAPHAHEDQDKFYMVVAGRGLFQLGSNQVAAAAGEVVWAPAGVEHGVANQGAERLTLLVGIAPSP
jgi:mannose-6-phosphate isomerase-like protein (cupin superfamily)